MGGVIVLAGALLFLAADSARKWSAFQAATARGERGRPPPALDAASPTGYQDGRRSQILQSTDGYHWVMQTQRMIAGGEWRLRHVDYDNAPAGRDVHWCSPLHWWLALVAWVDHAISGRPWLVSVENAALHAGPWLLGVVLLTIVPWSARRFGAWPAAVLAAGLVAVAPFSAEFGTGSYDHHGVAAACALLTVLFLLAGWVAPPEQARRAVIASGLAGAAGLWVNAATQIPVLAGLGAGAWLAHRLARREKSPPFEPSWWRIWGLTGAAASLLFYWVEYFPSHPGWRLEVNHPLHALAWAAAGDWLARWTGRSAGRPWWGNERDRLVAWTGLLAIALPPLLIMLVPARTFVVADRFLWMLHVDYISEFAPLFASWPGLESLLVRINLLPLLGLAVIWLLWRGRLEPRWRAWLALAFAPAALITLLALAQQRWLHVASALWLATLVAVIFAGGSGHFGLNATRRIVAGVFLALVLLPYPLRAGLEAMHGAQGLSRENIRQFAMRDLAYWLRRRTGTEPVVVLSGPTATTELVYHGGFRGIGTLYWENLAGLRALVDIYGAVEPARALELLRARDVTHLVMLPWGPFAEESARLAHGVRATEPAPAGTFGRDLLESDRGLPDWMRPLPYRLPEADAFKERFALVLEIVPEQTTEEAAIRRAQFLAAMGDVVAAEKLIREVLAANSGHVIALATLAQLQRAARDRAGHRAIVDRLRPLLGAGPPLALGDRVALAWELAAAGIPDGTRVQVARCWADCTEHELRRLPPESLDRLLRLTRDFNVTPPPALFRAAEALHDADRASAAP